jgi:hypothetical protein
MLPRGLARGVLLDLLLLLRRLLARYLLPGIRRRRPRRRLQVLSARTVKPAPPPAAGRAGVRREPAPPPPPRIRVPELLARVRRGESGELSPVQVQRLAGDLERLAALLGQSGAPAHDLEGLGQLIQQTRRMAAGNGASAGFESSMLWLLLEREVHAIASYLDP